MNSRDKYIGKIIKGKKPTKRQMKLSGKIAYDKENSKVGQSVWRKKIVKCNQYHDKYIIYVRMKCDKKNCDGHIILDSRNYKICNKCGLGIKNESNDRFSFFDKDSYAHIHGSMPYESINYRNYRWNNLDMEEFIYYKDKDNNKITERYKRIKRWENANRI